MKVRTNKEFLCFGVEKLIQARRKPIYVGINCLGRISLDTGGRTYLVNEIKNLARIDAQNKYYLFISAKKEDIFGILPPNFHKIFLRFSGNSILRAVIEQLILPFYIRKLDIGIFYAPSNFDTVFSRCKSIVAIRSLLFCHLPYSIPFPQRIYRSIFVPLSVKRASKVVTVSRWMKEEICERCKIPLHKVEVIYHGVDTSLFLLQQNMNFLKRYGVQKPYLLTVGVLWEYKNVDKVIEAFKILKKEYKVKHRLVIVGRDDNGNMLKYKELAGQLGMQNEIIFTGPVSHHNLRYFYSAADVFIFPSEIESFGLPLLEAMACQVPIVASNKAAIPEIVGDAGVVIDPHDTATMARIIYELINSTVLRKNLIKRGRQRIKQFDWLRVAEELHEVFSQL